MRILFGEAGTAESAAGARVATRAAASAMPPATARRLLVLISSTSVGIRASVPHLAGGCQAKQQTLDTFEEVVEGSRMATRLGVDVGGTFTDLIFYDDETGEIRVGKEPTTPSAPQDRVIAAVRASVPAGRVEAAAYFLHGTTVGLNSLLTRTGAVVGLLATRGFRDILEVRRGDRDDPYDLFWKQPPPLVPRRLRIPVTERMTADGSVHTPVELDDVRSAVEA